VTEILPYAPLFLHGLLVTVLVTVLGAAVMLLTAFGVGLARLSEHRGLRLPAAVFTEVFRGTSMLVQMFWFFYALPFFGVQLAPITAAVLALGLNEGAYAAEIVRSAISSRTAGQNEACIALGMGRALRLRRVLIPQSVPVMIPPFGNVLVDLLKNSALVSLVTVADLTFRAQMVRNTTGKTAAVFLTILVLYFVLSSLISLLTGWLERRFAFERISPADRRRLANLAEVGAAT
jgi:polar amino acid transport system permease protein